MLSQALQAPQYFVTYCTQGKELESNDLHHACLFVSKWPGPGKKMEVINAWGFYTERWDPTQPVISWIGRWRKEHHLDFDFTGNPGTLKQEKLRFFDQGVGLHGITFEISAAQASLLDALCKEEMKIEAEAINEAKEKLKAAGIAHPTPHQILEYEELRARNTQTPCRLQRFEIKASISTSPFEKSSTCKTRAIDKLAAIGIDRTHLAKLQKTSHAFPRFSGKLEEIFLHSRGDLYEFQKGDHSISLFRDWAGKKTTDGKITNGKLYWTVFPQMLVASNSELKKLKITDELADQAKASIRLLIKLEKIFEHETKVNKNDCTHIIKAIHKNYSYFSHASYLNATASVEDKIHDMNQFLKCLLLAVINESKELSKFAISIPKLSPKTKDAIKKLDYSFIDDELSEEASSSPELVRFC